MPDHMETVRWVAVPGEAAWEIERSRFIGLLLPLTAPDDERPLQTAQARYPGATHYATAWRYEGLERANDDGEPRGTAGLPLLLVLRRHAVDRAILIAIRYFGGIRLGRGGLYRAYGETGRRALDAARLRCPLPLVEVVMSYPYGAHGSVSHTLEALPHDVVALRYDDRVHWHGRLPRDAWERFRAVHGGVVTVHDARESIGVLTTPDAGP
jgi:putative IMPACT (imprinted ancient) family translation regulator